MNIWVLLAVSYTLTCLFIGLIGTKRRIGFKQSILLSVFLTPIIGLYAVLKSPKRIDYRVYRYKCSRCKFSFTDQYAYCPHCEQDGVKVSLNRVKRTMT